MTLSETARCGGPDSPGRHCPHEPFALAGTYRQCQNAIQKKRSQAGYVTTALQPLTNAFLAFAPGCHGWGIIELVRLGEEKTLGDDDGDEDDDFGFFAPVPADSTVTVLSSDFELTETM